jgi:steroid 5-alpha reductase family enzyme
MKLASLTKGYFICGITYVLAGILSGFLCLNLNFLPPLFMLFVVDIIATVFVFVMSTLFHNASLYDPYWSVAPFLIAIYWLIYSQILVNFNIRQFIVFILISIWSFRLTYNWLRQWKGIQHEDWRYRNLRVKHGKNFWFISLTGIHLMPTILVFLGSLSFYPSLTIITTPFSFLNLFGIIITVFAIIIESIADQQIHNFIKIRKKSTQIIENGLWKLSRHPNYLGEIIFWWGMYLFALGTDLSYWWMIIGPISITILFNVVSIPLMEKRNMERKPNYGEYKKRVSRLIPWFRKEDKH